MAALNGKQIDGIVVDLPTAFFLVGAEEVKNSTVVGQFPSVGGQEHFGMLFEEGNTLHDCVNGALAELKDDGTLDGIRVAIVRALAMQPELLLLDEVTSALDPELVAEVLGVIRELAAGGMTMLIATHEMGFARDIADRVCFLDAGVILEQGPPAAIFNAPREERTQQFLQRIVAAGRL